MVTPLPTTILVQDSNGTVVRARVQNPLVSDWTPKIVLPLVFPDPETIRANTVYAGTLFAGDGTAAAPSLSLESETTGFYRIGASDFGLSLAGTRAFSFKRTGTTTYLYGQSPFASLAFTDSGAMALSAAGTNQNITLTPSGTGQVRAVLTNGTFSLQNVGSSTVRLDSTGGMEFNVGATYLHNWALNGVNSMRLIANGSLLLGTTTDSSNGRIQLATHITSAGGIGFGPNLWAHLTSAQELAVGTTTVAEVLCINSQGLKLSVSGSVSAPNIFKNGDTNTGIWWGAADQLNLVTGGASALILDSFQNATFGSAVSCSATGSFNIGNRGGIFASADGVFRFQNNAGTDFSRLQFGGTTSSFPALRRNTTVLEAVLADSSDFANFTAKEFSVYGGCRLSNSSDGVLLLSNNAKTGFSRLQFGGTTSSFPALKRTGTSIHVRLADDTAFAPLASAAHWVSGGASTAAANEVCYGGTTATTVGAAGGASALPATPLGYILINVAGTAAKIPYYNN